MSYEGIRNHLQIIENKPCDEQRSSSAEKCNIANLLCSKKNNKIGNRLGLMKNKIIKINEMEYNLPRLVDQINFCCASFVLPVM